MTDEAQYPLKGQSVEYRDSPETDEPAPLSEAPPLPGSLFLAERMERRKFIRRVSKSMFLGFVAVSSGAASVMGFLASPAQAAGACCPSCCGPSPCCNTSCCNKGCCSPVGNNASCSNNGVTCFGYSGTWNGTSCWSCHDNNWTTICCDCVTNSQTNCANPGGVNRCICYVLGYWRPGEGPAKGLTVIRDASQVPLSHSSTRP